MLKTRPRLRTYWMWVALAAQAVFAQSTLTQIRDTVTNTDGTAFNGTVVITWNGFTGSSSGTTAPLSTSAHIYNGTLSVLLVPTTTASAGTFYQATYTSSNGAVSWTETWQVPTSTTALTLSTIRTSSTQISSGSSGTGTSGGSSGSGGTSTSGGAYATLPISINQITSLSADLASINSTVAALSGQLATLSTSINAQAGSSGTTANFIDAEPPAGTTDGTNVSFSLSTLPAPAGSLSLYRNGLLQSLGVDYSINGTAITFLPGSTPKVTDVLAAYYRVSGTGPLSGFTDAEVPGGIIDGSNQIFTLAATPSPALSLLLHKNGVLLTQNVDYTISGTSITFLNAAVTPQVNDSLVASYRH